jgi:hypothetical protein
MKLQGHEFACIAKFVCRFDWRTFGEQPLASALSIGCTAIARYAIGRFIVICNPVINNHASPFLCGLRCNQRLRDVLHVILGEVRIKRHTNGCARQAFRDR